MKSKRLWIKISLFLAVMLIFTFSGCSTKKEALKTGAGTNSSIENQAPESKKNAIETITEQKKATEPAKIEDVNTDKIKNKQAKIPESYKKEQTKSIIETIEELENCYKTKNYEKWKSLLTPEYKKKYGNPDFLKKNGWKANNLESFFYLLIETREKNGIEALPISRVEFVSPNKAYVYVLFKGKEFPKPQHTFIKIGDSWYKGLPEEGE